MLVRAGHDSRPDPSAPCVARSRAPLGHDPAHVRSPRAAAEFTLKAVVTGVVLGIVFGAANAYLGLRVGMTVSASIPAAVMTVAVFRLLPRRRARSSRRTSRRPSARPRPRSPPAPSSPSPRSSSGAWCRPTCRSWRSCFLGGAARPLGHDPAAAAADRRGARRAAVPRGHGLRRGAARHEPRATAPRAAAWIFRGMAVGAAVKLLISLALPRPGRAATRRCPSCRRPSSRSSWRPALLGVGFILGYRQSAVCVAGALISALALTPLIAWLGAGLRRRSTPRRSGSSSQMSRGRRSGRATCATSARARWPPPGSSPCCAGCRRWPAPSWPWRAGLRRQARAATAPRSSATDRDLPGAVRVRRRRGGRARGRPRARRLRGRHGPAAARRAAPRASGVFGVLFVAVAARIVGIVGVSSQPTSGIALVTLLGIASIFAAAGWVDAGRARRGADGRHHRGDRRAARPATSRRT